MANYGHWMVKNDWAHLRNDENVWSGVEWTLVGSLPQQKHKMDT